MGPNAAFRNQPSALRAQPKTSDDQRGVSVRKSYEKPEVSKVKLQAEEAVLTHCKSDHAAGIELCFRSDGTLVAQTIGS